MRVRKHPVTIAATGCSLLVEARGVEPLSENASTGTSPGADGYLHSLTQAWAVTLRGLVASLFMVRSKLCAHTCTTKRRPIPARGPSGLDGCVKPQRELRYRCSLIYKVAHFKDVRRIRPLFPPLRPRRNQYAPGSSQSPLSSGHPPKADIRQSAPLLLTFPVNPLTLGFTGRDEVTGHFCVELSR